MKTKTLLFDLCILLFTFFIPFTLSGQEHTGVIYPGSIFYNQTKDSLFYMPKQSLEILMEREEISSLLIQSLKERKAESDTLNKWKTQEANIWYNKLIEADKNLEEAKILMIKEKHNTKRKTRLFFVMGSVSGLLIGILL